MSKHSLAASSGARESTPGNSAPTKWGDREGRRRDILEAARIQMADGGYLALNMRNIARGAGVVPGTLYKYFSTKEEIFATLYADAIDSYNVRIGPICIESPSLEAFFVEIATAYLDLYSTYGRYFTLWSAIAIGTDGDRDSDGPQLPMDLARQLRRAFLMATELLVSTMRRLAPRDEAEPLRLIDEPMAATLLWTMLNGLGDHLTSERRHLAPLSGEVLIAFNARTLAAGLLAPA